MNKLILEDGYSIVYAAEANPRRTLKAMTAQGIKARELVEMRALNIIDSNGIFSKDKAKSRNRTKGPTFDAYFKNQAKATGRLFIGMPEEYFRSKDNFHKKLISAEQQCNNIFNGELKAICLHTRQFLHNMSLSTLVELLSAHRCIINSEGAAEIMRPFDLIALIHIGIDKALNNQGIANDVYSDLVFRTLKLVYHIDDQFVITHPVIFENTLQKMFRNSADAIMKSICNEIIEKITFENSKLQRDETIT